MKKPIEKFKEDRWIDDFGEERKTKLSPEQLKINEIIERVNELYDNRK